MKANKMEIVIRMYRLLAAVAALIIGLAMSGEAAATTVCLTNGGVYQCTKLQPRTPWSYGVCDDHAPSAPRVWAWCLAAGGVWNLDREECEGGGVVVTQSTAGQLNASFVTTLHGSCSAKSFRDAIASRNTVQCTNVHCDCQTYQVGGVNTGGYSATEFTGIDCGTLQPYLELMVTFWKRTAGCAAGTSSNVHNGISECYRTPPCGPLCGNPVDVSNGDKRQDEVDYSSAAPGGMSFVRRYNSGGFWDAGQRDMVSGDYWRHNYSSSVTAITDSTYVMAVAVRPDGYHRHFNPSGVEMQNNDGAAYRLQRLTDGAGVVTGWKITTPVSDVELYDAQGRLSSVTTRAGLVTALTYDAQARLATVTDAFGRSLALTYDADGRLAAMTDPASRQTQYGYDTLGRLTTVTYPDTRTRTYLYENTQWIWALTGIVDERGSRLSTYAYDSEGRSNSTEHAGPENKYTFQRNEGPTQVIVNTTDAFNQAYSFTYAKVGGTLKLTQHFTQGVAGENRTYDVNGNPASVTDRRGMVMNYVFDAARNLETSRTEAYNTALARTITTTWHPTFRLPATITETSGVAGVSQVTELTYDTSGNLAKKKLTAGTLTREWNYTYDARGQVLTIDGPRSDVTDVSTIAYYADADACVGCRGQVYTVTNAAGHVTTFNSYNLDGRPTQLTDANGVATALTYKTRGWLESRTVSGETTTYDYDAVGNLSKVTLPDGSWVAYSYDAANGLTGVDDSLGNAIDYELDVKGNRVQESVYDPQNQLRKTLQRVYNILNRLEKDLSAAGNPTSYAYDLNGNVTTVTDAFARTTATNTYDILNRLSSTKDAANATTNFTYDAKDRLKTVQDPRNLTTTYTYNGLGDLVAQASPDTGTTTFTHNAAGDVDTQTDARSTTTTHSYDIVGRVTAATVTDGTVTYEYDNVVTGGAYAMGRLTKITDPSGNTTYMYDALGRITSKTQTVTASPANKSFTVGYSFASGRQTGMTYPSGRVVTYGFNGQGQVTSLSVDGTTVFASGEYYPFGGVKKWTWGTGEVNERTLDLDGRVKSFTQGPSAGTYADLSQVFGYDAVSRLATANLAAGQTQSFTYDANHNRTNATINAASTTYTYPSTSHKLASLTGASPRTFTYDNAGSVISSAGITYTYDGRGRMKQAGTTNYLVNGLGQRMKKSNAGDVYFAYDEAGRLIGEYDAAGNPIQETLWLGDLPVAVVKPKQPSGFDAFYIWADHLGSPRLITDTLNQSRWEWAHNDPFGNNLANENPSGAGTFAYNLRFPGQYFDSETGKHYNYFRDYDPSTGRYVESDPIGLKGGINTYGYVAAQPLRLVDPKGLKSRACCTNILGGIKHCYIETQNSAGRSTMGLIGGWYVDMPGCGQVLPNNGFDSGGSCGEWNEDCTTDQCVKDRAETYPNPSRYSYLSSEPNSNSFAADIAKACKLKRPNVSDFEVPGWGGRGPPVPFPGVPQIGVPKWPITCPAPQPMAPINGG